MFTDSMTGWLIVVCLVGLASFAVWMLTRSRGRRAHESAIGTTATRNPHDSSVKQPKP